MLVVSVDLPDINEKLSRDSRRHLDTDRLQAEIASALQATGKVRVLPFRQREVSDQEALGTASDSVPDGAEEAMDDGNGVVQYRVVSEVRQFRLDRSIKPLPNFSSKYRARDSGQLRLSIEIIDARSGRTLALLDLSDQFTQTPQIVYEFSDAPDGKHFAGMARNVATQLADRFMSAALPIKVVKRTRSSQVIINRGDEDGMRAGAILEVFSVGEKLVDPDTGLSLGATEEYVGTLEIVRVDPRVAYAVVVSEVDPRDGSIKAGDIVRHRRRR